MFERPLIFLFLLGAACIGSVFVRVLAHLAGW